MKYLKPLILLFIFIIQHYTILAQNLKDTLQIKEVEINKKYVLGVNNSTIDSTIIIESINSNLSELLAENTSIFVKSAGRGALSTVSMRGTAPSHTDVLWNGFSLKSPMLGQVDFSDIPVFILDNISIYSGANSVINTSGAIGGSILIDNKAEFNSKLNIKYIQGLGSFKTYNQFLMLNFGTTKIQFKTRLFYNYSKNNFLFRNKNIAQIDSITGNYIYPRQKNKNAEFSNYGFLEEIYYKLAKNKIISIKYWLQNNSKSMPRLNTFEGDDYSNINNQQSFSNRIITDFSNYRKKTIFKLNSGFSNENLIYSLKNYISGQGYINFIYSKSKTNVFFTNPKFEYSISKNIKIESNYKFEFTNVETNDTVSNIGYSKKSTEHSYFISINHNFFERISYTFILRKNLYGKVLLPIIPFLGVEVILSKKYQIHLKSNITKNYKKPSLNDLYWQPGGNSNLKPEKGIVGDISINSEFKANRFIFFIEICTFKANIYDWIIWLPSPQGWWHAENVQHVVSKGVELRTNFEYKIRKITLNLNTNYSYTLSQNYEKTQKWGDDSYKKQLPYIPIHSGSLFVSLMFKSLQFCYSNNSYSERFTTSSNEITARDRLYPYFMNNISISKSINRNNYLLKCELKIENIFNEEYRSVLGRPMPGINYLLLISINYKK